MSSTTHHGDGGDSSGCKKGKSSSSSKQSVVLKFLNHSKLQSLTNKKEEILKQYLSSKGISNDDIHNAFMEFNATNRNHDGRLCTNENSMIGTTIETSSVTMSGDESSILPNNIDRTIIGNDLLWTNSDDEDEEEEDTLLLHQYDQRQYKSRNILLTTRNTRGSYYYKRGLILLLVFFSIAGGFVIMKIWLTTNDRDGTMINVLLPTTETTIITTTITTTTTTTKTINTKTKTKTTKEGEDGQRKRQQKTKLLFKQHKKKKQKNKSIDFDSFDKKIKTAFQQREQQDTTNEMKEQTQKITLLQQDENEKITLPDKHQQDTTCSLPKNDTMTRIIPQSVAITTTSTTAIHDLDESNTVFMEMTLPSPTQQQQNKQVAEIKKKFEQKNYWNSVTHTNQLQSSLQSITQQKEYWKMPTNNKLDEISWVFNSIQQQAPTHSTLLLNKIELHIPRTSPMIKRVLLSNKISLLTKTITLPQSSMTRTLETKKKNKWKISKIVQTLVRKKKTLHTMIRKVLSKIRFVFSNKKRKKRKVST